MAYYVLIRLTVNLDLSNYRVPLHPFCAAFALYIASMYGVHKILAPSYRGLRLIEYGSCLKMDNL